MVGIRWQALEAHGTYKAVLEALTRLHSALASRHRVAPSSPTVGSTSAEGDETRGGTSLRMESVAESAIPGE